MLADDAFARLVAEDVKNRVSQEQRDYLRLPENWDRWRSALLALIESLGQQLIDLDNEERRAKIAYEGLGEQGKTLWVEAAVSTENRRKKITRFQFHVEQRLAEADRMVSFGENNISQDLKLASFLSSAIRKHRELMQAHSLEPTPIDIALWKAIDGSWGFDSIDFGLL